ncbi:MAG: cell division protein FtsZ, partial [Ilumatobacteraceae bacterium]
GEKRAMRAVIGAINSPLLEAAIDGARGIVLNITGPSSMGLFEMNAAAEIIHGVAHQDANIIFGTVIDDELGDEVKVTVIAAGFDRWDSAGSTPAPARAPLKAVAPEPPKPSSSLKDLFADDGGDSLDGDDDFDVPSFLK